MCVWGGGAGIVQHGLQRMETCANRRANKKYFVTALGYILKVSLFLLLPAWTHKHLYLLLILGV